MALSIAQIQAAYVTFFNRPADVAGLAYWESYQGSDVDLYNTFAQSAEYTSLFAGQNNTATVNTIYNNLLGRSPDAAGLNYWVAQLDAGNLTIGTIANAIKTGAQGTDAETVENKAAAATAFTAALNDTAEIVGYASPSAATLATVKAWLAAVTTDATLATQIAPVALAAITSTVATAAPDSASGSTFTLTTAVGESLVGTSGNDDFRGVIDAAAATPTVNAGDVINGGSGTDTLILIVAAAAVASAAAFSTSAVETVNLNVGSFSAHSGFLTSALYANATSLNQIDQTNAGAGLSLFADVTVGSAVTAGFQSTGNATTAGNLGGITVNGATATQTSLTANVNGVLGGEVLTFLAAAGATEQITTINVSGSTVAATAATNTLTVADDAGTETLNLSLTTATRVIVADGDNSLTTIDMSGSTGNVRINTSIDTLTSVDTVTGGSGNNTLFIDAGTALANNITIDLGAGNDSVGLSVTTATVDDNTEITLGAGADTVVVGLNAAGALGALSNIVDTNVDAAISATELVANLVTIADFNTAEDVLNLDTATLEGTALTEPQLDAIKGAASLSAAVATAAGNIGVGTAGVFSYGGNGYVFVNNTGAGTVDAGDALIKLSGVADSMLFDTNQGGNLVI